MKLVYVMSYSCMNCLRSFEKIQLLTERYRAEGLHHEVIHAPEWDFEKEKSTVAEGLKRHSISLPFVHDAHRKKISKLGITFWPSVVLMDGETILHTQIGEGNYVALETAIRTALGVNGKRVFADEPSFTQYPCLYLGTRKGEEQLPQIKVDGNLLRTSESACFSGTLSFVARGTQVYLVCASQQSSTPLDVKVNVVLSNSVSIDFPDCYFLTETLPGDIVTLSTTGCIDVYAVAFA